MKDTILNVVVDTAAYIAQCEECDVVTETLGPVPESLDELNTELDVLVPAFAEMAERLEAFGDVIDEMKETFAPLDMIRDNATFLSLKGEKMINFFKKLKRKYDIVEIDFDDNGKPSGLIINNHIFDKNGYWGEMEFEDDEPLRGIAITPPPSTPITVQGKLKTNEHGVITGAEVNGVFYKVTPLGSMPADMVAGLKMGPALNK